MKEWKEFREGTESGFWLDLYYLRLFVRQRMGESVWRAYLDGCLSSGPDGKYESAELAKQAIVEFAKTSLDNMAGKLNN